jgi:hypothetical protein
MIDFNLLMTHADALLKAAEDWPTAALEHLGRT